MSKWFVSSGRLPSDDDGSGGGRSKAAPALSFFRLSSRGILPGLEGRRVASRRPSRVFPMATRMFGRSLAGPGGLVDLSQARGSADRVADGNPGGMSMVAYLVVGPAKGRVHAPWRPCPHKGSVWVAARMDAPRSRGEEAATGDKAGEARFSKARANQKAASGGVESGAANSGRTPRATEVAKKR